MKVEIHKTPNPNALKFVIAEKRFPKPLSFANADAAAAHALASLIFATGRIYNVFMVQDFVTVNKLPDASWEGLDHDIAMLIANYVTAAGRGAEA